MTYDSDSQDEQELAILVCDPNNLELLSGENGELHVALGSGPIDEECCCCDCNCCTLDPDVNPIAAFATNHSGGFGNTTGALVSSTFKLEPCNDGKDIYPSDAEECLGRIDFTVQFGNGACMATEETQGYACLVREENENGWCCYWKIFVDPPTNACLAAGFPNALPAIAPYCLGGAMPDDCGFITPFDPCYGLCGTGGFDLITFRTNSNGDCSCPGDEFENV